MARLLPPLPWCLGLLAPWRGTESHGFPRERETRQCLYNRDMNSIPESPIHPGVRIGHVHLKVADIERALAFYRDILGFEVTQRMGSQAAFLSAGGYHHHIGLNTWESAGGSPPPPGA